MIKQLNEQKKKNDTFSRSTDHDDSNNPLLRASHIFPIKTATPDLKFLSNSCLFKNFMYVDTGNTQPYSNNNIKSMSPFNPSQ